MKAYKQISGGLFCIALLCGCDDSGQEKVDAQTEKIARLEKNLQQQGQTLKQNAANHQKLAGLLKTELTGVYTRLEALKKENEDLAKKLNEMTAFQKTLLDQMWTDAVDKDAFEKYKAGLNVPAVRVKCANAAPVLDGQLDAAYLKLATPMKFYPIENTSVDRKTDTVIKAYVLQDPENLYVALRAEDASPQINTAAHKPRDSALWEHDCIEVFIGPNEASSGYYHIIANTSGSLYDAKHSDTSWNASIDVKFGIEKDKAWVMEMKIPLRDLGVKPGQMEKTWIFNMNCFSPTEEEHVPDIDLAWSPTGSSSSHVPGRFGKLWMVSAGRPKGKDPNKE